MDGDLNPVLNAQRRGSLRRAVSMPVVVTSSVWPEPATLTVVNLSQHGMWLRSDRAVSVGERLSVSFRLPGSAAAERMSTSARVVRVAASCGCELCAEVAGLGVCFSELSEGQREALARSLRGLPPPLPGASTRVMHQHEGEPDEPGTPIIPACALMTSILSQTRFSQARAVAFQASASPLRSLSSSRR